MFVRCFSFRYGQWLFHGTKEENREDSKEGGHRGQFRVFKSVCVRTCKPHPL